VCFDGARFACNSTAARCSATAGCRVGYVCVKEFCNCGNGTAQTGVCVSSEGCGMKGENELGMLVYKEGSGRSVKLF
jgi:hypothetical protein